MTSNSWMRPTVWLGGEMAVSWAAAIWIILCIPTCLWWWCGQPIVWKALYKAWNCIVHFTIHTDWNIMRMSLSYILKFDGGQSGPGGYMYWNKCMISPPFDMLHNVSERNMPLCFVQWHVSEEHMIPVSYRNIKETGIIFLKWFWRNILYDSQRKIYQKA